MQEIEKLGQELDIASLACAVCLTAPNELSLVNAVLPVRQVVGLAVIGNMHNETMLARIREASGGMY